MPEKRNNIFDSIFGAPDNKEVIEAQNARNNSFQSWLDTKKQTIEGQRKESVDLARFNALGNVLTAMVQPFAWKQGGATVAAPAPDNRQYLDAFNRAVKANEDLRNIGDMEAEYQFKLADDNYRRELAMANAERKHQLDLEKQKQLYDLRGQLSQQQMQERIAVAEAQAKARYQFKTGNTKVTESVRDNLLKRANTAYANILADYYKKKQVGIENLQAPPSYDDFLKQFASENGYQVAESQNAKPESKTEQSGAAPTSGSRKPNPMGGGTTTQSGKKKNPMNL